jgi:hypothetical protein
MPAPRRLLIALSSLLAVGSTGCSALVDLIDGDPVATVKFHATHAGTPTEDGFPDLGDEETTRVFTNDQGWLISIHELYVTTAQVRLVRCSASEGTSIEMFWGACPEDFVSTNDRETFPLGAVTVTDGDFCRVDVHFAPFIHEAESDEHINPDNPMIEGNTILLNGIARRGEGMTLEEVPFSVVSDTVVVAEVDIGGIEQGQPFHLEDENFARDITLLKTYDHFFDGIDFATATPAEIEAAVLSSLELDTRAYLGDTI